MDLDQDLVGLRRWPGDLGDPQHLRWPVPVVDDGPHRHGTLGAWGRVDNVPMQPSELSRKLKVEPGDRLLIVNGPPDFLDRLQPLPDGAALMTGRGDAQADVVSLFAGNRAELERDFTSALAAMKSGGRLWISYPAVEGNATDLSRNHGWHVLHAAGLTATDVVSLDGWEAIRFQPTADVPGSAIPAADMLPVGRRASPLFRFVRLAGSALY